ncbi:MAG: hypothetical protein ABI904_07390 [Chloroflexota bacterium]
MLIENLSSPKFKRIILFIGLAVLVGGLGLFTFLSYYNRYWADDWCYNADLRNKGFIQTLGGYFYDTTYTPSRYSVTIFAGLLQIFGVLGVQWMTPLTILFWVVGLIFLFRNTARLTGLQIDSALIAFISALIVYFSIYLTPHLYQSLYWRTGLLTYTTPLVLTTWLFVLITRQGLVEKPSNWGTVSAGMLALLTGGCSEAGTTVLISALGMYVLFAGVGVYRKQAWARKTLPIALVSLVFAIVALGLLIFSPSTLIRKARYGTPTSLFELPKLVFNYTYAFFVLAVKDGYHILIALLSALVGFVYPITSGQSYKFSRYILLDVMVVLATTLLVAASLTPSIYIERGLPAARTIIIPDFIAVSGFAIGGWVAGSAFHEIYKAQWSQVGAAILLLISFAFPIFTVIKISSLVPVYSQRTQAWDVREALIQKGLDDSSERVTVEAIDGLPVGGIRDFDPKEKKGYWITQCAMDYYGIRFDVVLP